MQDLYYKSLKTIEEAASVKALSEKVVRLEQALEQAQNSGTPRQHEILEEMARAHQYNMDERAAIHHKVVRVYMDKIANLEESQDSDCGNCDKATLKNQLKEYEVNMTALTSKIERMRNCDNCQQRFCDDTYNNGAVKDCEDNNLFHWEHGQ
jgi:hypothetical protein